MRRFFEGSGPVTWHGLRQTLTSIREALGGKFDRPIWLFGAATASLPSTTDHGANEGAICYDETENKPTYYDGSAWNTLVPYSAGAALTRVNDTNVTLTLGGSPTTALLQATSITVGWTGTLAASRGGTGVSSLGDITRVNDTNVTLTLGGTPTGAVITSTSFTLGWTGQLSVARGGTGAATLTGLLQGNGTSAFTAITNSTTVGQVLRVTGSNTYAWGALDLADTDAVTGTLPVASGGTGVTSSTGSGSNVLSASPTFTGTISGADLDLTGTFACDGAATIGDAVGDTHAINGGTVTYTGNQNATTTFSIVNTDTTSSLSRALFSMQGGGNSFRVLCINTSVCAVGTTTASDVQIQRNSAAIATFDSTSVNITSGLSLRMNSVDVITSARHPLLRSYTVAALPAANDGELAFASNGRKTGEGAGAGTGVPVYRDGGTWFRFADDTAVAA